MYPPLQSERREFLRRVAALAGGLSLSSSLFGQDDNHKLNLGFIGPGGRGASNLLGLASENVVALCDVDDSQASAAFTRHPSAKQYRDFRQMLDKETSLDAVVVSTPDHTHAAAAIAAMHRGLHVYCEKPLAHSIREVRLMRDEAKKAGVVTQLGTQGHAMEGSRRAVEVVRSGAIGDVRELHVWTDRPNGWWPQGEDRPTETPAIPDTLDWDLWLGPAPVRPYHPVYVPFKWRGRWDFGTGAIGDMGVHNLDTAFWALELGLPTSAAVVDSDRKTMKSNARLMLLLFAQLGCGLLCSQALCADHLGDLTGPWILFVDDHAVAQKENVTRVYHPFTKHDQNPIMIADKPWEGSTVYLYGTVLPAEDGTGYRMWYHSWAENTYRMLYATSPDGLRWEKPALDLVDYKGSKQNNILFRRTHENHSPQVIHTPWEQDPAKRYRLVYYEYGRTPPRFTTSGYFGLNSPDGIHWTDAKNGQAVLPDHGDVGNFGWDSLRDRYFGSPKIFDNVRGYRRRCVGFSATTDFEIWPPTKLVLAPDEFDDSWVTTDSHKNAHTDFYGMSGFAYESMYIGFLWVFRITDGNNDGPVFVELVTSHDGEHWTRQEEPRQPILPLGSEGSWDDGMLFTPNHPLVSDGMIKLYYGGFDVTHGSGGGNAAIGLATLRKDGFASLDAGQQQGSVTTNSFVSESGTLAVNYTSSTGSLRAEILDEQGTVLAGYSRDECNVLTGDSIEAKVTWRSQERLPNTASPIQIRFILRDAAIYSYRTNNSEVTR